MYLLICPLYFRHFGVNYCFPHSCHLSSCTFICKILMKFQDLFWLVNFHESFASRNIVWEYIISGSVKVFQCFLRRFIRSNNFVKENFGIILMKNFDRVSIPFTSCYYQCRGENKSSSLKIKKTNDMYLQFGRSAAWSDT